MKEQRMAHKPPSSHDQNRGVGGTAQTTSTTGRLRSACDSCHQAKIKCSGGNPCSTCQRFQGRCVYSAATRLGRPKGSRNKRTLMQERSNEQSETDEDRANDGAQVLQWTDPGQQHSDQMPFDFGLDHTFEPTFMESLIADDPRNLLTYPNLGLIQAMCSTGAHTSPEDDLQVVLGQTSSATAKLPTRYCDLPSETSGSSTYDSGYATGSVSPTADDTNVPSPHGSSLPGSNSVSTGAGIASNQSCCSCLQQLAKLLYHLGDLQYAHAGTYVVDSILQAVQLAQSPWNDFMQCSQCQNEEIQKEPFLLFAMSIRILLFAVQKLNVSTCASSDVVVSVGTFQLTGEARSELIAVALRRLLQTISSALLYLWERTGRPRSLPTADSGGSSHGPDTPVRILTGASTKPQRPSTKPQSRLDRGALAANPEAETITSLLNTLHYTMKVIEQKS